MQTTLKREFSLSGTGLHSGHEVRVRVRPARAGQGVRFRRVDIRLLNNLIPAKYDAVVDTRLCTTLGNEAGVTVSTVEHMMAALAGCGVHNATVEVNGPEVPIMDGCSENFVHEIQRAGIEILPEPLRVIRVLRTVRYEAGDAFAEISPAGQLQIDFEIEFPDPAIGRQAETLDMANGAFVNELSNCRTFCLVSEISLMQNTGFALGGSLDNAVVIDGDKVLNAGGFRRKGECVRHKMLDAFGDLSLAGAPILGRYRGVRAGHGTTNALLRKFFATPNAWETVICNPPMENLLPGTEMRSVELSAAI